MAELNIPKAQKKTISIRNTTTKPLPITTSGIKGILRKILKSINESGKWSIGVIFLSDRKILELNKKYLNLRRPTDVMVFTYPDRAADIAISLDTARSNAKLYKTSLRKEIILYLIHGILHMKGYDDTNPQAAKRMLGVQEKIFKKIRPKGGFS